MERLKSQPERLSHKDRQKLLKVAAARAGWFRAQFAAAPSSIRERYIPLLATSSLLMHENKEPLEQEHLSKMLAIQADILSSVPGTIGGVSELQQFIESEAGSEREEWYGIDKEGRLPQAWKNAKTDAERLAGLVSAAESEA